MMRALLLAALAATTLPPLQGAVILARNSGSEALYLWDATAFVKQLVTERNVGPRGLSTLEAVALNELLKRARTSRSRILRMKVLYTKTGEVSKVYGTPTFAGVEDVVNFTVTRKDLLTKGGLWVEDIQNGKLDRGLQVKVTGKLPPPAA